MLADTTSSTTRRVRGLRDAVMSRAGDGNDVAGLDSVMQSVEQAFEETERLIRLRASASPDRLKQASRHLLEAGGKRVRPLLCLLTTSMYGGETQAAARCAAATELVHAATLLHDDVVDEGDVRRGRKATRVLWGNLTSVLAGDLLLTDALKLIQECGNTVLMGQLVNALSDLVAGEVRQLEARWRRDLGMEGYLEIVRGKTASLFGFACRGGALIAEAGAQEVEAAGVFGEQLGIAFQVVDDVLDIEGETPEVGKKLGVDFAEGKTTLPLALALRDAPEEFIQTLRRAEEGDRDASALLIASPLLQRGCQAARVYAQSVTEHAVQALRAAPDNAVREALENVALTLTARRM